MDVYEGGLPTDGTKLWPKTKSEAEGTLTNDKPGVISTTKGSAPVSNGTMTKDFLDDKGYGTGSMSVDNEPSLKVVNPDDIK